MSGTEKATVTTSTAEKTAVTTSTAEKKKLVTQGAVSETVVYIGPTIPSVVAANTILSNGITKELAAVKNEVPAIGTLIVSTEKLAQARMRVEMRDTPENICYEKVQKYLREKKGE